MITSETFGLEMMLAELESSELTVVLVPTKRHVNEGGVIRVAQSRNATWYRRFYAAHSSDRVRKNAAFDTRIKRRATILLLETLIAGAPSRSKYAADLLRIASRYPQPVAVAC